MRTIKIIFLIMLLSFILGCQIGNYKLYIEKINDKEQTASNISKVSILELNLNPSEYDGKTIQIRGKAVAIGWVQTVMLEDDDGLQVMIKDTIEDRSYDYGKEYTAIGIFHNKERLHKPFYLQAIEPVKK